MVKELVSQGLSLSQFMEYVISNKVDLGITFSMDNNGLKISIKNPVIIELANELELSIGGEANIISKGLKLDTLFDLYGTALHLNSREAKQIKDLPTSIKYRNNVDEKMRKLEGLAEYISHPSLSPDASLDEKIEFLQTFKPTLIE